MSWTNPKTWSVGEKVTAAMLNAYLRDNQSALAPNGDEFTDYTPNRTSITVGNGTEIARYLYLGKLMVVQYQLTLGSTSSIGSSPLISPPTTIANVQMGQAEYRDTGTIFYRGLVYEQSGDFKFGIMTASGSYTQVSALSATIPFTWTNTDVLKMFAIAERA